MAEALSTLQLALLAAKAAEQRRLLQAEPIAIVGVGCRFPAGPGRPDAANSEAFWQLLTGGIDAVGEVPASRWPLEQYYDPTPGTPGKMHCRHGGFLAEIDQFDPASFGLSPKEAAAMDPQHRLLLEVAAEA
ncbi:MAG: beta-ketoacyl synthase N-terminal-like domain-containing protein, partial [Cyanobacteriota bacterium]|nr:beta-ketoacyl synthase N-terminal-like domain-containing protein [Cyanobacteriota bacterium]